MSTNTMSLEEQLLQSTAGRAVFDALVQANVNLHDVSLELVKQMLVQECRFLKSAVQLDMQSMALAE